MSPDPIADAWIAAVRRCGGRPKPGEKQMEFVSRVAQAAGVTATPKDMPERADIVRREDV